MTLHYDHATIYVGGQAVDVNELTLESTWRPSSSSAQPRPRRTSITPAAQIAIPLPSAYSPIPCSMTSNAGGVERAGVDGGRGLEAEQVDAGCDAEGACEGREGCTEDREGGLHEGRG